jgi:hypothetical protein
MNSLQTVLESAAHRCLGVPELQKEIFFYFEYTSGFTPESRNQTALDRETLAYLARTCKSFHSTATESLWRFQPYGFAPLLSVLPLLSYSSHEAPDIQGVRIVVRASSAASFTASLHTYVMAPLDSWKGRVIF